jgi:hypothetical protein
MRIHPKAGTVLSALLLVVAAQGADRQFLNGHLPQAVRNSTPTSFLPASQRLPLAVCLPLRDREGLTNLLREIYNPNSPNFHHYLTSAQFAQRFGPSEQDYQALTTFAEAHGLKITTKHANRTLLDVEGSVADIEKTLHVRMGTYLHPNEQRTFYAPDSEPSVELAVPVLRVSGLNNYALPRPRMQASRIGLSNSVTPLSGSGPSGTYRGADFRAAYAPGVSRTGTGQKVGLVEFDGYNASDITNYEAQAGLPNVHLTNILLDGFNGTPVFSGAVVEVCLDIEVAIAMAPGLDGVLVYEAGPYGNWHDLLNRMATDNLANQLSCSWYTPGGGPDPVADQIFQQMAAQGQSFFNASGDYDAYTGPIDFPGDTPFLTQVGGTTLTTSGPGGARISERVWNWGGGIGSGGGISTSYAIPSWQASVNMTANLGSSIRRNTPDVALTADNVYVRANGGDYNVGGTSAAAPLWAGFAALINEQAAVYGEQKLGFANPAFYAFGLGSSYGSVFHDITIGNNFKSSSPNRFPAVTGYDLATGWGTPNGQGLIDAIAIPDSLRITPPGGFASSGAVGGPFSLTTRNYTLTNSGASTLTWSASNSAPWLNVSPLGGVMAVGTATNVSVSLNPLATMLPPADYTGDLWITNQSTGFIHDLPLLLQVSDPLVIRPTNGFASVGPVGGPFTITSTSFSLSNSGMASLDWAIANSTPWLNVSPSAGTIPTGLVATVTVGLNATASNLPPSFNSGSVTFSNITAALVQSRQFTLQTGLVPLQNGGFETGNFLGWILAGNTARSSVTSNPQYVHAGSYGAALGPSGSLGYLFQTVPTVPGHLYLISFWLENPGLGTPNEFLVGWHGTTVFDQLNIAASGWTNYQVLVAAQGTNTELELGFRNDASLFGLDDVAIFETIAATNPPAITSQPVNVTVNAGLTATFTVGASGIQPFFYQWQRGGANILGATNASLTISPTTTNQAGSYAVVVSNLFGATVSSNALLTVNVAPCVPPPAGLVSWWGGQQDASDYTGLHDGALQGGAGFAGGEVGSSFDFTAANAFVQAPASPAWAFGTNDFSIELWVKFSVLGGTRAFIADDQGGGTLNKWIFFLNNGQLQLHLNGPSIGAVYLGSGAFNPGLNQWHHVAVTRSGTLFAFYVDGALNSTASSSVMIPDASAPLTIGMAENLFYLGGYEDEVAIYNRALSGAQMLGIYNAGSSGKCAPAASPSILAQPQSQTVTLGGNASLSVVAAGNRPLSYQWRFNGTNLSGATASTLTLTDVHQADGGPYAVVITNVFGSVTSSNAVLSIYVPVCVPAPSGITAWWAGQNDALDILGVHDGVLQGAARFAHGEAGTGFDFTGANAFVQVPASPQWAFGTNDFSIELWVKFAAFGGPQAFIACDQGQFTQNKWIFFLNNGQLQFHVNGASIGAVYLGSGAFNPGLNQWHHVAVTRAGTLFSFYADGALNSTAPSGVIVPDAGAPLTIGTAENLLYLNGYEDEISIYNRALSANEILGIYNALSAGKCVPAVPPSILTQPPSQTVNQGRTMSLGVTAAGSRPLSYQWRFNGANLNGATGSTFVVPQVQVTNAGSYSVVVTNLYGSIASSNAVLTVTTFACDPVPAGLVAWWAGDGNIWDSRGMNDGVLEGPAGFATGKVGAGFDFTGPNSYVQVPASPLWAFGANGFSIELWVKFVALGGTQAFIAYDQGGGSLNKWIFFLNNGQLQMHLYSASIGAVYLGSGSFNPGTNQWHHVAMTRNGTLFSFYVDGVLNSTSTSSVVVPDAGAPLTIGTAENLYYLHGYEDEISIYNRGLASGEIQAIYNAAAGGKCPLTIPPAILSQPQGQTVPAGASVGLSVSSTGSRPLSYQWLLNGASLPGATTSSLSLTNVQPSDSGAYAVAVTNWYGSVTSSNAVLTVYVPVCVPPPSGLAGWWRGQGNALDFLGANNGVLEGGAGFAGGEVGTGFDFTGANGFVQVPVSPHWAFGANDFAIELWVKFAVLGGTRAFIAYDQGGGTLNKWIFFLNNGQLQLHLNGPSIGAVDLGSGAFNPGLNQWHHVAVTRSGTLFSFYVDGAVNSTASSSVMIPDANAPLTIGMAENLFYLGGYEDEVAIYNRALSAAEILGIYNAASAGKCLPVSAPTITAQPQNQGVLVGSNANFSVVSTGTLPLSYQWKFNGIDINGATGSGMSITNVQGTNGGTYSVVITNVAGTAVSSNALLTILYPPAITTQPRSQLAFPGCTITFSCTATGTPPLIYLWQRNGLPLAGQTNTNLTLPSIQSFDFATYTMIASNAFAAATSSNAVLALDNSPAPGGTIVQRFQGGGIRVNVSTLLAHATDSDGDPMDVIAVSSNSVAGGTVALSGISIYYAPPPGYTNADAFNYTLSDGHCGGTATGTVLIEVREDTNPSSSLTIQHLLDGTARVYCDGIHGYTYHIQRTDSLGNPDWQEVFTGTADQFGTLIYLDQSATNAPIQYYRSVWP